MKTLEAWCKSQGYSGGTIWQCLEACGHIEPMRDCHKLATDWVTHSRAMGESPTIFSAYVPYNSFSDPQTQVPSYIKGLIDSGL